MAVLGFHYCMGFSLGAQASVVVAPGHSHCITRGLLLRGMWNLHRSGMEPVSPSLAGGFFTTEPPGKPWDLYFYGEYLKHICNNHTHYHVVYVENKIASQMSKYAH